MSNIFKRNDSVIYFPENSASFYLGKVNVVEREDVDFYTNMNSVGRYSVILNKCIANNLFRTAYDAIFGKLNES